MLQVLPGVTGTVTGFDAGATLLPRPAAWSAMLMKVVTDALGAPAMPTLTSGIGLAEPAMEARRVVTWLMLSWAKDAARACERRMGRSQRLLP